MITTITKVKLLITFNLEIDYTITLQNYWSFEFDYKITLHFVTNYKNYRIFFHKFYAHKFSVLKEDKKMC